MYSTSKPFLTSGGHVQRKITTKQMKGDLNGNGNKKGGYSK